MKVKLETHAELARLLCSCAIHDQDHMSYGGRDLCQTRSLICKLIAYSAVMEIMCACSLWGAPWGPKAWHTFDIVMPRPQHNCRTSSFLYVCHTFTPTSQLPSLTCTRQQSIPWYTIGNAKTEFNVNQLVERNTVTSSPSMQVRRRHIL